MVAKDFPADHTNFADKKSAKRHYVVHRDRCV